MTLRRGRPAFLGSVAVAVVLGLAVAGCAPSAAPVKTVTGAYHGLTVNGAEAAYQGYIQTSERAAASGDETLGLSDVADAQWAVVKAQYDALALGGVPVPQYSYGTPTFYVPALTSYPQWFVVSVPRSLEVEPHPGAAVNTVMLFENSRPGPNWTLNGAAALNRPLPRVARDSDGYATAVSGADSAVLLRPDVVGATQAAVADEGPANAAATVIADGPQTTGLYAAQAGYAKAEAGRGLQYQWLLQGSNFPQYGLRTADGGALWFYGMYLNTTTEHPALASGSPGSGPAIPVPAAFQPLLVTDPAQIGYHAVYANWTFQYVAVDPPLTAHGAKAQVIADGGGPSYVHAT